MMAPTSAIDPSIHYVNLANQMHNLQLGNTSAVNAGFLSPQYMVWPQGGVPTKHAGNTPQNANHGGGNQSGYNEAD